MAGEDHRYALSGPGLATWLPGLLGQLDGKRSLEEVLAAIPGERRELASAAIERLYGERVLVEGTPRDAHQPASFRVAVEGQNPLAEALRAVTDEGEGDLLAVLCQDRLDLDEASRFNARCAEGQAPWLWVTCGPLSRGYVSPVFLPDAGPCLDCLLRHFQRLSPAPEVYERLSEHAARGGEIAPALFPSAGLEILAQLARWKAAQLREAVPAAALYRLHVLEVDSFEVSTHRVFADPECLHGREAT